ncbi:MAG: phosphate/phosphite/phosphonate ABC transporter substrate-binding protein [Chloroflexota bacterium]
MLRTVRGPLGLTLVAALVLAACGGGTTQPQPTTAATVAPTGPRLGSFDRPIIMAFVPSQDTARVSSSGKAIAAFLEKTTALKWDVKVPTSYAATIEGMCAGQIDVAWLAPLSFVLAADKNCADVMLGTLRKNPLSGKLETTYDSQILVRADSGINDVKGLKGKKFAFVDPLSASGTLFPTLTVKQQGGEDPKTFFSQTIFAGGHDKAVLALYQGQVDGAASFIDVRDDLEKTFPDIKQKTKRISTSGPIPNDTVSVRKGFPAELRDKIQSALIEYSTGDDGKKTLKSLYNIDGLDKVDPKVFDSVREAAKLAGIDLTAEAAKTARPVATPAPSPTKAP